MLSRYSPLAASITPGRFGAAGETGVTLNEAPLGGAFQIAGWDDFDWRADALLQPLGLAGVTDYAMSRAAGQRRGFRVAPDRILVLSEPGEGLQLDLADGLAVLDLSHARTRISIRGAAGADVASRLAGIDFRDAAFPVDRFVQTGIHGVGVLIFRPAVDEFQIAVPITWAQSIWSSVCLAAEEVGYTALGAE